MIDIIKTGWLQGHLIRKARKVHRCDYWRGTDKGGRCVNEIRAGDYYVEGEMDPERAGGYGVNRYCFECAGAEIRTAFYGYMGTLINASGWNAPGLDRRAGGEA